MQRNSFVQMSKLSNVRGRIYYISSDKKQENLYAVYETTDRKFWTDLAKCNQAEFKKSGTEGKCIEARELIIALPESFVDYSPDGLLKYMTDKFKSQYGVDCIAALHHNKRKTNYHIHLIFAERNYLDEPIEKIDNMKARLEKIVQEYGYQTVDEFYRLFNNASSDYYDYKEEVKNWEAKYGEKSLQRKLAEKQAEVKKRQEEQDYIYRPPTNRGAR
ncbi:MobA/MobL family protein [Lachnospira pectinoschiza]|uniref:MobA/MobL family protein n=1 Tax=Lachnospira pectinoschiza TaxID=28052 RepID=A0A1G9TMA4_9FIRM|nr:hypothetical protein [Lachnospira pectinoschiza]SDM48811.1 MobA/MobL family protein [Lachnospira pectinoschiza]